MKNYYRIIYISRESFSKEKLENRYKNFMKILNQSYEQHKNDRENISKLDEMKAEFDEAYSVLSDDDKRKELDSYLDEEKQKREEKIQRERQEEEERIQKEKEKQEKYACFKMYDSSLIKSVKYRRNTVGKIFFLPYTFDDGKTTRKVDCELKGVISYSTDWKDVNNGLARYEVETISTNNPERKAYKVITPLIDYNRIFYDEEYKKAVYEGLFSEKNLERSKHENYEYLGRIVHNEDGYSIDYNKEEFCSAVRFGIKLKRRVDNPSKRKVGVICKFKRVLQKVKEKSRDDEGR